MISPLGERRFMFLARCRGFGAIETKPCCNSILVLREGFARPSSDVEKPLQKLILRYSHMTVAEIANVISNIAMYESI